MADRVSPPEVRLVDGDFYAGDPHPAFAWMRREAPLLRDPESGCIGVARHADILFVSKHPELFCNRHGMRPDSPPMPSMINLDDPHHKRRRNLVNRGFTPRRVAELEPRVRAVCRELLDAVAPLGRCDFVRDVAAQLPMIMIGDLLGVAPEDRGDLLRWSDDLITGTSVSSAPDAVAAAMRAFEEYAAYHRDVVADHRERGPGGADLMSVLVHAEIDGERLDDDALLQESLLILVGGDETTRHVISGGMEQLLRHPDQRRRLQQAPERIPTAVEEMLRWVTPIQNMMRTATQDVVLGGERIREGDRLLLLYPSGNRDEEVFDDPYRFDVTRSPNDHLTFGGYGAHFCLGSSLARLELRVLFEEALPRLPDMALASDARLPRRSSNFIVGIESMPVEYTPAAG